VYAVPRVFQHLAKEKREREVARRNAGVIGDSAGPITMDETHPKLTGVQHDQLPAPLDPLMADETTGEEPSGLDTIEIIKT